MRAAGAGDDGDLVHGVSRWVGRDRWPFVVDLVAARTTVNGEGWRTARRRTRSSKHQRRPASQRTVRELRQPSRANTRVAIATRTAASTAEPASAAVHDERALCCASTRAVLKKSDLPALWPPQCTERRRMPERNCEQRQPIAGAAAARRSARLGSPPAAAAGPAGRAPVAHGFHQRVEARRRRHVAAARGRPGRIATAIRPRFARAPRRSAGLAQARGSMKTPRQRKAAPQHLRVVAIMKPSEPSGSRREHQHRPEKIGEHVDDEQHARQKASGWRMKTPQCLDAPTATPCRAGTSRELHRRVARSWRACKCHGVRRRGSAARARKCAGSCGFQHARRRAAGGSPTAREIQKRSAAARSSAGSSRSSAAGERRARAS